MTRHLRGNTICGNALEVRLVDAEEAVLMAFEHDLLYVEVLETALYKALAILQAQSAGPDGPGRELRNVRLLISASALSNANVPGAPPVPRLVPIRRREHGGADQPLQPERGREQ